MKSWIAYSLLLLFLVVNTPKQWWHDCTGNQHVHLSKKEQSKPKFSKKCVVCDVQLSPFIPSEIQHVEFTKTQFSDYYAHVIVYTQLDPLSYSNKGPPML